MPVGLRVADLALWHLGTWKTLLLSHVFWMRNSFFVGISDFVVLCTSSRLWIAVPWTVFLSCMRNFLIFGLYSFLFFFFNDGRNTSFCVSRLSPSALILCIQHNTYYYYYYDFHCFLRTGSLSHFSIPPTLTVYIFSNSGFASFLALFSYISN